MNHTSTDLDRETCQDVSGCAATELQDTASTPPSVRPPTRSAGDLSDIGTIGLLPVPPSAAMAPPAVAAAAAAAAAGFDLVSVGAGRAGTGLHMQMWRRAGVSAMF